MKKHQKQQMLSPEKYIRTRARTLPVGACFINDNWQDSGFALIMVTRVHINGNVTHGAFVVDLYCLGVKEAYWRFNESKEEFQRFLAKQQQLNDEGIRMRMVDYGLAHNIICGAIAFAEEYGFHPHKSFEVARFILEEDTEKIKLIDVEFGYKGKPLYISSSERPEERNRVLAHLEITLGRENYYYITEEEVDDFFEREEEQISNQVDYQNPEVKRRLIRDFLELAHQPEKKFRSNPDTLVNMMEKLDEIYFSYMVSEEELDSALITVVELFDFRPDPQVLSDALLFGSEKPPLNHREIRREAERLYDLVHSGKVEDSLREAERMRKAYPGILVFEYLMLRSLERRYGLHSMQAQLISLSEQYPGYLPFVCLTNMCTLFTKNIKHGLEIPEELHLKRFFPHRTSFSKEEVLLYVDWLLLHYRFADKTLLAEALLEYLMKHFPGLLPREKVFLEKALKVSVVKDWCTAWMEEHEREGGE